MEKTGRRKDILGNGDDKEEIIEHDESRASGEMGGKKK